MKLYHVILTDEIRTGTEIELEPKVPLYLGYKENTTIKRVCFAPTILQCVMAISYWKEYFEPGYEEMTSFNEQLPSKIITVLEIDTEEYEGSLITPQELYEMEATEDCMVIDEYWVTKPVIGKAKQILVDGVLEEENHHNFVIFYKSVEEELMSLLKESNPFNMNLVVAVNKNLVPLNCLFALDNKIGWYEGLSKIIINGVEERHPIFDGGRW